MSKKLSVNTFIHGKGLLLTCSVLALLAYTACRKASDPAPKDDPRLTRPYCNDPEAVNYNWDFPGKPDSTVCIYPSDLFAGSWQYSDSIVSADGTEVFDSAKYQLQLTASGRMQLSMKGLCGNNQSINITASRNKLFVIDTVVALGQYLCINTDTIAGGGSMYFNESNRFTFTWVLNSDTGISYHHGTAVKQ
jgi:hypothetical protein